MKPMRLPYDERAHTFRKLIERCHFNTIMRCVESSGTGVSAAFCVDPSVTLEQVAVVAAIGDDVMMTELMISGVVKPVDACGEITDEAQCHVIYIEPAYLIQFTH
jgi:hypothetical protein